MRMSNVISLFPNQVDYIRFYEVVGEDGHATYGSGDAHLAIEWYTRSRVGSRIFISAWDSDEEDAHLIGRAIDITGIVNQALAKGRGE
jgi:hypothetical protein